MKGGRIVSTLVSFHGLCSEGLPEEEEEEEERERYQRWSSSKGVVAGCSRKRVGAHPLKAGRDRAGPNMS